MTRPALILGPGLLLALAACCRQRPPDAVAEAGTCGAARGRTGSASASRC